MAGHGAPDARDTWGTPDTPARAGAKTHVVLDDIGAADPAAGRVLALSDDVAHHLRHVLRLREGDAVTATDGRGGWRTTVWRAASGVLEASTPVVSIARPAMPVAVAFALTKGDKPELVVQKLTELGVDRIVPFVADRSIVAWDAAKAERNVVRWRAVAREALRQSRQVWEPEVAAVVSFADLCDTTVAGEGRVDGRTDDRAVVRADLGGPPPDPTRHRLVLIGPEGGWSAGEQERLPARVSLGSSVLRAETAAIAAAALLVGIRTGLVNAVR